MREIIGFFGLISLVTLPYVAIGFLFWDLKKTNKEHEKRINEIEKKLK